MKKLLIILVLVAVAFGAYQQLDERGTFGGRSRMLNTYPPGSPLFEANQQFVDRVNANPDILALFDGVESKDALAGAWNEALQAGARSLPGDRLVAVAGTQVKVMARLPEASCAKVVRPHDPFDPVLGADTRKAMEKLPARHHELMADFAYDALAAKAAGTPAIPVDEVELDNALRRLGDQYSGVFGERLMGVMRNPRAASDEDACWVANSFLNTATQLPEPQAEALLRRFLGH